MRKFIAQYCRKFGLQISQTRFMVDGERVAATDTAESLNLQHESILDVCQELDGRGGLHPAPSTASVGTSADAVLATAGGVDTHAECHRTVNP